VARGGGGIDWEDLDRLRQELKKKNDTKSRQEKAEIKEGVGGPRFQPAEVESVLAERGNLQEKTGEKTAKSHVRGIAAAHHLLPRRAGMIAEDRR